MDQHTYLVLRVTGVDTEAFDLLTTSGWRSGALPASTPGVEYRVDAQTLDQQDYRALCHDREVAAMARPMPLRLIQPVAAPGPSAEPAHIHDATWGVFVTGALQSPYVGHGVTVAVLDTGIDATHEAFRGVEVIQKDFTGEGDGDKDGHGTHVAGTIFGQTVQGVRYGVAPGVRRALIGLVIGAVTETAARLLNLWRYHQAQTPMLNVIGMFGLIMGGMGSLVPEIGLARAFAAGLAAGLVYEVLNLRVLHWWYFPEERMGFIAGHKAIIVVLALLWGTAPLIVATANAALPRTGGRPTIESRLEALNVRERRLLEKLDLARQQVRDLETRLEAVRTAKQALTARQTVRPLAPEEAGSSGQRAE